MTEDELQKRKAWFDLYVARIDAGVRKPEERGSLYACPCCGYPTLTERGGWEICVLCFWEDDGQDDPHADEVWGGPNSDYSLAEARRNFAATLSMYRPSDAHASQLEAARNESKQALIDIYEMIRVTSDDRERKTLWRQARKAYARVRRG